MRKNFEYIIISTGYEDRLARFLERYPPRLFKEYAPDLLARLGENFAPYLEYTPDVEDESEMNTPPVDEDLLNELEEVTVNTSKLFYFVGLDGRRYVSENLTPQIRQDVNKIISELADEYSFAIYSGDYLQIMDFSIHRGRGHGFFGYCATFGLTKVQLLEFEPQRYAVFMQIDAESG